MRKFLALLLVILVGLSGGISARAQGTAEASLFALDASAFPTMSVSLDVFDASGNFISGLNAGQVTLLENNQAIVPATVQELQPGAMFAVVLDPGASFAFQNADAVSRFDKVVQALQDWTAIHSDALGDDLSLIPNDAKATAHVTNSVFSEALAAYDPDLATITSSSTNLAAALDTVSDTPPQTGMKPVVLYITSVPSMDAIPGIEALTERAASQGIRVHVWIVDSKDYFATSGATALKDLAIITGGQYTIFSGEEVLPQIETYLTPVRHTYSLTYSSSIRSTGSHTLSAQVSASEGMIVSPALTFDLAVEAPNPILVTPPAQIVRQGADPRDDDFAVFEPILQPIELVIEFPDSHPRPLVRTAFYVDGVLVGENTAEPFDRFVWDLSGYTQSAKHTLQVEATDNLGLTRVSIGIPVMVTVVQPERGLVAFLARNSVWVVVIAVGLAGLVLTGILLFGRRKRRQRTAGSRSAAKDPLTQPIEPARAEKRRSLLKARPAAKQSGAYLVRLKDDGQPITSPPIPVVTPEMTFGSDPIQATKILDDPSVSPLHARLKQDADGGFTLSDENSTAGTWLNFEQITAPRRLTHGDVLHIGRLSYRFMLSKPPEKPAPQVLPKQP